MVLSHLALPDQAALHTLQTLSVRPTPIPALLWANLPLNGKTINLTLHPGHIALVRGGRAFERHAVLRLAARHADSTRLLLLDHPEHRLDKLAMRGLVRTVSMLADTSGTAVLMDTDDRRMADMADTLIDLDRQLVSGRSSWQGRLWQ